jgi:ABC-type transport system involved in multi-copper enzyme maturation permease subunit
MQAVSKKVSRAEQQTALLSRSGNVIAVFRKAFRDSSRVTFWLVVVSILYVLLVMAFYPSMIDQSAELDQLLEAYPKEMMQAFYGGDVEDLSISEPGNYIQSQFIMWMELMMGAIVVVQAFNALTNAERDGTLDVMLSLPVSRRAYLVGRVANSAAIALILLVASWVPLWLATYIWPEFDVSPVRLAMGMFGLFWPVMVVAGFVYLLAAVVPSSKHFAGPLAYLFLMGSYILYMFAVSIEKLNSFKPVFLFHYYNGGETIRSGVPLTDWLLLAGVALVYFVLAWWFVDKKELGV